MHIVCIHSVAAAAVILMRPGMNEYSRLVIEIKKKKKQEDISYYVLNTGCNIRPSIVLGLTLLTAARGFVAFLGNHTQYRSYIGIKIQRPSNRRRQPSAREKVNSQLLKQTHM